VRKLGISSKSSEDQSFKPDVDIEIKEIGLQLGRETSRRADHTPHPSRLRPGCLWHQIEAQRDHPRIPTLPTVKAFLEKHIRRSGDQREADQLSGYQESDHLPLNSNHYLRLW